MQANIRNPLIITPRLMAGARIGDGFISIGYSDRPGDGGRTRYHYAIDTDDGTAFEGHDLQSGAMGGELQDGLSSLLAFLLAAAETYEYYLRTGRTPEDDDPFPVPVVEWISLYQSEIELLALEVEETPGLIHEAG